MILSDSERAPLNFFAAAFFWYINPIRTPTASPAITLKITVNVIIYHLSFDCHGPVCSKDANQLHSIQIDDHITCCFFHADGLYFTE